MESMQRAIRDAGCERTSRAGTLSSATTSSAEGSNAYLPIAARAAGERRNILAKVPELELDAEVLASQQRDRLLQVVAGGAAHPDLLSLDGRLHLLQLRVL